MPPEFYKVRVTEDGKIQWRGLLLVHIKDLSSEQKERVINEIRRLHQQGLGWVRIQKQIAESLFIYVPYSIIRKIYTGKEICWERCGLRGPKRSLELRMAMYKRVIELRAKGLSYRQIQQAIQEEFGVHLSDSHVYFWCKGIYKPDGNIKKITINPDIWWLIGLILADGCISVVYIGDLCICRIKLALKDRVLIEKAAKLVGCSISVDKKSGTFYIVIHNRQLYDLVQKVQKYIAERRYNELLEMMGQDGVKSFVKGFFDGDGSGLFTHFANADLNILEFIKYALKTFYGIVTSAPVLGVMKGTVTYNPVRKRLVVARKNVYVIFVLPDHYHQFYKEIGTTLMRKINHWKLSEKALRCYSKKYGRTPLEEIRIRYERGENWTEVLIPMMKAIGRIMQKSYRKTPTPDSPLFHI